MELTVYVKAAYPYIVSEALYEITDQLYNYGIPFVCMVVDESYTNQESLQVMEYVSEKGGYLWGLNEKVYLDFTPKEQTALVLDTVNGVEGLLDIITYIVKSRIKTVIPLEIENRQKLLTTKKETNGVVPTSTGGEKLFFKVGNEVLIGVVGLSIMILMILLSRGLRHNKRQFLQEGENHDTDQYLDYQ